MAPQSSFVFPNERPSCTDWKLWGDFGASFTGYRGVLNYPLGGIAGPVPLIMGMALPQIRRYVIPMAGGYNLGIHSNSNKGNSTIMPRVPLHARCRPNTRQMGSNQRACCSGKCSSLKKHRHTTCTSSAEVPHILVLFEITRRGVDVGLHPRR
jgi:hypothetical protein